MYKGSVAQIPCGQGGYNGSENYDIIPINQLIEANNICFDGNICKKMGGLTLYDANAVTSTPTCLAGIDWNPTSSTQRQVTAWGSNKVYKETSGNMDAVELLTGITFAHPIVFAECGQEVAGNDRKLLMFSRGLTPYVLAADGTSMTAIANPSGDWATTNQPSSGIYHDQRVVAWGNNNAPHTLYFSTLSDHTDFLTDSPPVYDINPGDGERIVACVSMLSTRLYIFKYPTGIYWIDTSNVTASFIPVTTVRKDIGMVSPNGITKVGSLGTWFIGSDGHIYSLESSEDPDIDLKDVSITGQLNLTKWIKDNVNPTYLKNARLVYDSNRKEVRAMYTKYESSTNDLCLVINIENPANPKIAFDNRGSYFQAAWFSKDSTTTYRNLLVSGTGGFVYKADQSSYVIGAATAYTGSFRTPDSDLSFIDSSLASRIKRFDWLEFIMQDVGASDTLQVAVYIDGTLYNIYSLNTGSAAGLLDDVTYGLDVATTRTSFTLAGDGVLHSKIRIGGYGKRIGLRCYNSTVNESFKIAKINLFYKALGAGGEV